MLLELLSMGCASAPVPRVEVTAACPGPRAALVAVGDRAGTVRIVDLDRGLTVRTLVGESLPVTAFDWSAEGRMLGVLQETARETTTSVWDVDSGTRRFVSSDPVAGSGSFVLALDDAGEHVLTWGRSTALRVRSTCDEAAFAPPTIEDVRAAAWIGGSGLFVSGDTGGRLSVWSASTGQAVATTQWPTKRISCLAVAPDGRRLIVGAHGAWISAWTLPDLHFVWSRSADVNPLWDDDDSIACIAFAPAGDVAFVGTRTWWSSEVLDVVNGVVVWSTDFQGGNGSTMRAAVSPDGTRVAHWGTGSRADGIRDMRTGGTLVDLGSVRIRSAPGSLGWTSDGRTIVLDVYGIGTLQRLDASTLNVLDEIVLDSTVPR